MSACPHCHMTLGHVYPCPRRWEKTGHGYRELKEAWDPEEIARHVRADLAGAPDLSDAIRYGMASYVVDPAAIEDSKACASGVSELLRKGPPWGKSVLAMAREAASLRYGLDEAMVIEQTLKAASRCMTKELMARRGSELVDEIMRLHDDFKRDHDASPLRLEVGLLDAQCLLEWARTSIYRFDLTLRQPRCGDLMGQFMGMQLYVANRPEGCHVE